MLVYISVCVYALNNKKFTSIVFVKNAFFHAGDLNASFYDKELHYVNQYKALPDFNLRNNICFLRITFQCWGLVTFFSRLRHH